MHNTAMTMTPLVHTNMQMATEGREQSQNSQCMAIGLGQMSGGVLRLWGTKVNSITLTQRM